MSPYPLAHDGFVTVLEKVSVAPVDPVEVYRIAGKQPGHDGGKGSRASAQEEVDVIGQEYEGITGSVCLGKDRPAAVEKILPVRIVQEYPLPFDAPDDHMVENACRIESGLSGHRGTLSWGE
jgi:hypothetical protein